MPLDPIAHTASKRSVLLVSQSATHRRPPTMRRRHTSPRIDDDDSDYPGTHTLHSHYTTNGSRQLVCSACSGEAKAFFLVPAFSTIPLKRPQSTTSAKSEELSHSTTQHYTRWERLQSRAFPSGMSERWLDASADGRKCLLRWRMTRLEPVPGPQKILNETETQKLC
jgi:hypothetical protein